jgi:hypothetical protein
MSKIGIKIFLEFFEGKGCFAKLFVQLPLPLQSLATLRVQKIPFHWLYSGMSCIVYTAQQAMMLRRASSAVDSYSFSIIDDTHPHRYQQWKPSSSITKDGFLDCFSC